MGIGLLYSPATERAVKFLFPPKTRPELALRHLETEIPRWVETLRTRHNLELDSDITTYGPTPCPFIEDGHFGDDMWIARGVFKTTRMREVDEDLIWASQELAKDLGITHTPKVARALPNDFADQMSFIKQNLDGVYADVVAQKKGYDEEHAAGLI